MAKVIITPNSLEQLAKLDYEIQVLNKKKIKILFDTLGISPNAPDFEKIMGWNLIAVSVSDRQMAKQLNDLLPYVPNIIFEVNEADLLFTIKPGVKKRRVRKDR